MGFVVCFMIIHFQVTGTLEKNFDTCLWDEQ